MTRNIVQNKYSEEFKRNVVAVIKSGLSTRSVARMLNIPVNTIAYWVSQNKFFNVEPASKEVLAALPVPHENMTVPLVPITKTERKGTFAGEIKIKIGKMEMSLPQNFDKNSLVTIIKALGEAGVL